MSEEQAIKKGLWGIVTSSFLRYDDPCEPATDPMEWEAIREASGLPLRETYISAGAPLMTETAPVHSGSVSAPPPPSATP